MEKQYDYTKGVEYKLADEATPTKALANRILRICLDSFNAIECKHSAEFEISYQWARLSMKEELVKIIEEDKKK